MTFTPMPVQQLPSADSVTNDDHILIYRDADGRAYLALAELFKGADATINGKNVLTIEAGDNIELSQSGGTLTLSANISGVFIFKGPATLATLPAPAAANLGFTYNMTQAFTTTADFIEGAGKEYSAGADVAVCDAGNGVYKYNVLSIDLSGLVPKTRKINGHALSADVTLTKSNVGLGAVDNTSDADKPVSTAQQAALDAKQNKLSVTGAANKGIYVSASGVVSPMTYELNKSVPANAVFTDTNTTYTLTQDANDGHKFTLTGSDGTSKTITIPDNNTTYTPATAAPLMDGTAAAGMSAKYAREDHRHPTDTSRASAADVTALQAQCAVMRELIIGSNAEYTRTASGNPVTFEDGYDAANVKALSVTITPTQSGTGDPSPENIRPITGVSSVSVTRTGENGANPQTVTVALTDGNGPLTVYGGALDVTTGELTVTHKMITLPGSGWYRDTGRRFRHATVVSDIVPQTQGAAAYPPETTVCSHYKRGTANQTWNRTPNVFSIEMTHLEIVDPQFSAAADFQAFLNENAVQFGYPLAEPVTYQLTPAQLATLSGYNAVSTDADTLSVTYRADPAITLGGD